MNALALSIDDCDELGQMEFLEQEANVLGLGNLTMIDGIEKVLVHGKDVYKDLYAAFSYTSNHDYVEAGITMGKVLSELNDWTNGHICDDNQVCYVVNGMLQYLNDFGSDLESCSGDLHTAWIDISDAYRCFSGNSTIFSFSSSHTNISQGLEYLGRSVKDISEALQHCHVKVLSDMLLKLAEKFGLKPDIGWAGSLIYIVINGVQIENQLAHAYDSYMHRNWPGFGYDIIKMAELFVTEQAKEQAKEQATERAMVVV